MSCMASALTWCCEVQEGVLPLYGLFPSPLWGRVVVSLNFGLCTTPALRVQGEHMNWATEVQSGGAGNFRHTLISEVDPVALVMNLHCLSILIKRVIFILCSQHSPSSSSLGAFFLHVSLKCLKASCLQNKHPKWAVSWLEHWHLF